MTDVLKFKFSLGQSVTAKVAADAGWRDRVDHGMTVVARYCFEEISYPGEHCHMYRVRMANSKLADYSEAELVSTPEQKHWVEELKEGLQS